MARQTGLLTIIDPNITINIETVKDEVLLFNARQIRKLADKQVDEELKDIKVNILRLAASDGEEKKALLDALDIEEKQKQIDDEAISVLNREIDMLCLKYDYTVSEVLEFIKILDNRYIRLMREIIRLLRSILLLLERKLNEREIAVLLKDERND